MSVLRFLGLCIGLVGLAAAAAAVEPVNQGLSGVAVEGVDVVAYFSEGRPVEGSSSFTHDWNGATWRFASAEHRDRFAADPERYAPRYGGYCAYAVAKGTTASIDPEAWKIVDGRLYLNYSPEVQELWEADRDAFIAKADASWPRILEE